MYLLNPTRVLKFDKKYGRQFFYEKSFVRAISVNETLNCRMEVIWIHLL